MINIVYSPGCYGTYLSKCLYNYTNLANNSNTSFEFGIGGDSHDFRENVHAKTVIDRTHPNRYIHIQNCKTVAVIPNQNHILDYYNNQFHKELNLNLLDGISPLTLSRDDVEYKLKIFWGYTNGFNESTPRWITREFFSMWIQDCFDNGYSIKHYADIPAQITIDTQDIILNFESTFNTLCQSLDLTITVNSHTINQNHANFIASQLYLNSQQKCIEWVNATLTGIELVSPVKTIFDEAYIQHVFRTRGYEIMCNDLNQFPKTSTGMAKLIYENSNNSN
jgi:hypothetical protein